MLRALVILLSTAIGFSPVAMAAEQERALTYEDALRAYKAGDYAAAARIANAVAEAGQGGEDAPLLMAYLNKTGKIGGANAWNFYLSWLSTAAARDSARAKTILVLEAFQERDRPIPDRFSEKMVDEILDERNRQLAIHCAALIPAAESNYAPAELELSHCYDREAFGEQDLVTARIWRQRAANHGNADAWIERAADHVFATPPDDAAAQRCLDEAIRLGASAQEASEVWGEKAFSYLHGSRIIRDERHPIDVAAALRYIEKARQQGMQPDELAKRLWDLAEFLRERHANVAEAEKHEAAAVAVGAPFFSRDIARKYANYAGNRQFGPTALRPNLAIARRAYGDCAKGGDEDCQLQSARMAIKAEGGPRDLVTAYVWLKEAGNMPGRSSHDRQLDFANVAAQMSAVDIAEAERRWAEWKATPKPRRWERRDDEELADELLKAGLE